MPTTPAVLDIPIARGSSGSYAAIVLLFADPEGFPLNLSGATVSLSAPRAGLSKSTANGSLALDIVAGSVAWVPTQAETQAVPAGRIVPYECSIEFSDGSQGPYLCGYLIGYVGAPPIGAGFAACRAQVQGNVPGSVTIAPAETRGPSIIKVITPGAQGARGDAGVAGGAASAIPFQINNVSSFVARHGFAYTPRVTLEDASGMMVDADTYFSPGQVSLVFPSPFTGRLTLA